LLRQNRQLLNIGAIARQTGIGVATLRKWELRYGFPKPQRTLSGLRIYSRQTLEDLLLVCQRMAGGERPGKVIRELNSETYQRTTSETDNAFYQDGIKRLLAYDTFGLSHWLGEQRTMLSTEDFVEKIAAPMARQVGDLWFTGDLPIYAEHLFSAELETALTRGSPTQQPTSVLPRILLVAPAGERHLAGLRMAGAVLEAAGETPLYLPSDLPVSEIVAIAKLLDIAVVGLTASVNYPPRLLTNTLASLRKMLPASTAIWAGGSGILRLPKLPENIVSVRNMAALLELHRALPPPPPPPSASHRLR
jgi:MerR family transcriptional regulator, light-induced transcriptional regulator